MNTHELALLATILAPVAVLTAMHLWLFLGGERDTLLLPAMRAYPSIPVSAQAGSDPVQPPAPAAVPANDERLREAA